MNNPFKSGDQVKYNDSDTDIFYVYTIYSDTMLSLCLRGTNDQEQDYQTHIKNIRLIKAV